MNTARHLRRNIHDRIHIAGEHCLLSVLLGQSSGCLDEKEMGDAEARREEDTIHARARRPFCVGYIDHFCKSESLEIAAGKRLKLTTLLCHGRHVHATSSHPSLLHYSRMMCRDN